MSVSRQCPLVGSVRGFLPESIFSIREMPLPHIVFGTTIELDLETDAFVDGEVGNLGLEDVGIIVVTNLEILVVPFLGNGFSMFGNVEFVRVVEESEGCAGEHFRAHQFAGFAQQSESKLKSIICCLGEPHFPFDIKFTTSLDVDVANINGRDEGNVVRQIPVVGSNSSSDGTCLVAQSQGVEKAMEVHLARVLLNVGNGVGVSSSEGKAVICDIHELHGVNTINTKGLLSNQQSRVGGENEVVTRLNALRFRVERISQTKHPLSVNSIVLLVVIIELDVINAYIKVGEGRCNLLGSGHKCL